MIITTSEREFGLLPVREMLGDTFRMVGIPPRSPARNYLPPNIGHGMTNAITIDLSGKRIDMDPGHFVIRTVAYGRYKIRHLLVCKVCFSWCERFSMYDVFECTECGARTTGALAYELLREKLK